MVIRPGLVRKHILKTLSFPSEGIIDAEVITAPLFQNVKGACYKIEGKKDLYLDLSKLGDCDYAMLRIKYEVSSHEITKKLVDRKSQVDVTGVNDEDKYWMTARLRSLKGLETICGSLDMEDVDLVVDVGIYENVRTSLPRDFIVRLETLSKALHEPDRNKRMKMLLEYNKQRAKKNTSDDFSRIGELKNTFYGREFRQFIEVDKPFLYSDAKPNITDGSIEDNFGIPKQVRVISRTNLSLDKPAAEGYLHYKSNKLNDVIREMLS